jgi:hypothetical protein
MNILTKSLLVTVLAGTFHVEAVASDVVPFAAKTETIRGIIAIVDPAKQLVIVKNADGIYFDFKVEPTTRIEVTNAKVKMEDLSNQIGSKAEVTFRVLRTGDIALKIEVNPSPGT